MMFRRVLANMYLFGVAFAFSNAVGDPTDRKPSSNNQAHHYRRGVQESCSRAVSRGRRCNEANITEGECYDLSGDSFMCVGDNVIYKNISGVVGTETLQDILNDIESSYDRKSHDAGRDLVSFKAGDIGYAFVDVVFTATDCRKATFEWQHSTPGSTYISTYDFYDIVNGVYSISTDQNLKVNYYENQYQDYDASHRVILWDTFAKNTDRDLNGFGALMDVWPDTTQCIHEFVITSGGVSTSNWDAEVWEGGLSWSVSWPAGVSASGSATPRCIKHSASFTCYIDARSGIRHKNTIAMIAPMYKWTSGF
eukprot:Nitzschia sp. Nitz4//scaffold497_size4732//955//1881//NITZ4_009236-RA/size4732-processed-gene-0.6-mRNA-1//-1//CDS//3329553083//1095//frame0